MKCTNPISIENKRYSPRYKQLYPNATRFNLVPCGKCKSCLINYLNSWCLRFELQARESVYSKFVTLTYDDYWLPVSGVSKRDIQLLFKRIRKFYPDNLNFKYVVISEYGPTTLRPHYHLLSFSDFPIEWEKFWTKGFVTVDDVIPERFAYVAKYHIIKGFIQPKDKNPTFRLSSRGIGLNVFSEYELANAIQNINYVYNENGFPVSIPKYFKDKLNLPKYVNPPKTINVKIHKDYNSSVDYNTQLFIDKLTKKSKL